jgi:hypothetical protein
MTRRAVLLAACALLPAQAPAPGAAGPEGLTLRTCAVVTQDRARNYPAGCWDTFPRGVRRVYIAVYGLPIGSSWDAVLLNPQGRPMASVRNPVARAPSVVWFGAASLPVGSYTVRIMPSAAPPAEISFEIVPPPDPAGPPAVTVDAPREVRERASLPVVARTAPGATCTGTGTTTNHPLGPVPTAREERRPGGPRLLVHRRRDLLVVHHHNDLVLHPQGIGQRHRCGDHRALRPIRPQTTAAPTRRS